MGTINKLNTNLTLSLGLKEFWLPIFLIYATMHNCSECTTLYTGTIIGLWRNFSISPSHQHPPWAIRFRSPLFISSNKPGMIGFPLIRPVGGGDSCGRYISSRKHLYRCCLCYIQFEMCKVDSLQYWLRLWFRVGILISAFKNIKVEVLKYVEVGFSKRNLRQRTVKLGSDNIRDGKATKLVINTCARWLVREFSGKTFIRHTFQTSNHIVLIGSSGKQLSLMTLLTSDFIFSPRRI